MGRKCFVWAQIALTLSLLLTSGCAGLGQRLEAPRVSFANVKLQELKGLENVIHLELRVFNTNDVAFKIKAIDCDLSMNGQRLATGVSRIDQEILAYDTALIPLTLYSSVVDLFRGIFSLQDKEKVVFSLTGKLRVEGGWTPSAIPFRAEKELSLEGVKKAR